MALLLAPVNFWLLVSGGASAPPASDVSLCERVVLAHQAGDATEAIDMLCAAGRPVAVETSAPQFCRSLRLPSAGRPLTIREVSFGEGGLGGTMWEASIAMAIWLATNAQRVRGRAVLELGAGVGTPGLAAALLTGAPVTLTDRDAIESSELIDTISSNAAANGLSSTTQVRRTGR